MQEAVKDRVSVRMFLGFLLPADLKFQLNRSIEWKQAEIDQARSDNFLAVVRFQDAEYLGRYLDSTMMTLGEIKKSSNEIKEKLKVFAPNFDQDLAKIAIFPQVFVS